MVDTETKDWSGTIDIIAAVVLGIATVAAAFAAYQSSLWGGNCLTAYTHGTNKLGEANREMLRGVQEMSFDTSVWIEAMKAEENAKLVEISAPTPVPLPSEQPEAAEGETGEVGDEAEPDEAEPDEAEPDEAEPEAAPEPAPEAAAATESAPDELDARIEELVLALTEQEDASLAVKLQKLQDSRRDLSEALKWAEKTYQTRMATLTPESLAERVVAILRLEDELIGIDEELYTLLEKFGVSEDWSELDIQQALAQDESASKRYGELEEKWSATLKSIEMELDKLGKPMFYESPQYSKKKEHAFKKLNDEGNALIVEGQKANSTGDQFTKITVLFTVALFFAGLAATLRRNVIKIVFLALGIVAVVYSAIQLFTTPFA